MKKKRIIIIILSILSVLIIIGCVKYINREDEFKFSNFSKPDGIRQEVWDEGVMLLDLIDQKILDNEQLTDEENKQITYYIDLHFKPDEPKQEAYLANTIMNLRSLIPKIQLARLGSETGDNWEECYNNIIKSFGKLINEQYK